MRRTASHLLASPNPAQLEMRILANHGADRRFAFLRGRWAQTWEITKSRARLNLAQAEKAKQASIGAARLGSLAGYGDSDEEGSANHILAEEHAQDDSVTNQLPGQESVPSAAEHEAGKEADSDGEVKKARRARAKEWAEKRRAMKQRT